MYEEQQQPKESKNSPLQMASHYYSQYKDQIIVLLILVIIALVFIDFRDEADYQEKVVPIVVEDMAVTTTTEQIDGSKASDTTTVQKSYSGSDSIKDDYIIDTDAVNVLLPSLQERTDINPQFLCVDVLKKKETRNNVYYFVEDELRKLVDIYSRYRSTYTFINDDLNRIQEELNRTVDECAKRGYHIR